MGRTSIPNINIAFSRDIYNSCWRALQSGTRFGTESTPANLSLCSFLDYQDYPYVVGTNRASNTNYGIFMSDAGDDIQKKLKVEQLAQAMIQNGTPASIVAEAIDANSFTSIKKKIEEAEKAAAELQQAQQKAQQEMQQQKIQSDKEIAQMELQSAQANRDTQIEIALINAQADDDLKRQDLQLKAAIAEDQAELDERKLDIEEKKIEAMIKKNASK